MVSKRSAGRPPRGEVAQKDSRTALRTHIACKLAGRHDSAFLDEIGVAVNTTAVGRAGGGATTHPDAYTPPGPHPGAVTVARREAAPARSPALRQWLAVDYEALDISLALVTVRAADEGQQLSLYSLLRDVPGVVQVLLLVPSADQWLVMAVVAWDGEADARRLRGRFKELGASWGWQQIEIQTVLPAQATWRHLAVVAAKTEGLCL